MLFRMEILFIFSLVGCSTDKKCHVGVSVLMFVTIDVASKK